MIRLVSKPLTAAAFQPYGEVIEEGAVPALDINQGFAQRYNDVAHADVGDGDGETNVALFIANPRPQPIAIALMERHPLGSQAFVPLQDRPWLVLVCDDPLKPESYHLFAATGKQGINYAKGAWHHPLLVRDAKSRFLIIDRKGPGNNLEEVHLPAEMRMQVAG